MYEMQSIINNCSTGLSKPIPILKTIPLPPTSPGQYLEAHLYTLLFISHPLQFIRNTWMHLTG